MPGFKFLSLRRLVALLVVALLTLTNTAYAHKPSDSYLALKVEKQFVQGRWDIALRDLDYAIGLDSDDNGELTWEEVRTKHKDIAAYALARLTIANSVVAGEPACRVELGEQMLEQHSDGTYAVIFFKAFCADYSSLKLHYQLLFDIDPQHKGLLKLSNVAGQVSTAIFSPETARQEFSLSQIGWWQQFSDYMKHGMFHIWIGYDHILFLLCLLLPAVLLCAPLSAPLRAPMQASLQRPHNWVAATSFKSAGMDVFKIVTAFTVAHSITLSLASLQILNLPTVLVESAIALSVILAALNNIYPVIQGKRWLLAFVFGLIHGFGFASVLADLGLPQSALVLALVGFNVGVELGQLAIVAVFLPLAYLTRKTWMYQKLILNGGSVAIVLLAAIWLCERVFDLRIFPA
nr:HupE/UreJ family protein [uncultured Undibacterium sp.]